MHFVHSLRRRRFVWLIPAAILLVAAGDLLFWQNGHGGAAIGVWLAAILAVAVAMRPTMWRDPRAWAAVAAALLFAGAEVEQPGPLAWSLFWIAAGMAVLLPATARFDDGWRWFQRLVIFALRSCVGPLIDLARANRARRRRSRRRIDIAKGLALLALPVSGSVVILFLFASANPVLDRLIADIVRLDRWDVEPVRMFFWFLLFVTGWSLLHPRPTQRLAGTFDGSGDLPLPGVSVASVTLSLVAFNLLFAVQNLMDLAYLGGVVPMPEGIGLAEYAHRGAYPLIATALLAALFVLVTLRPGSSTAAPRAIRRLVVVWIAQNLILVTSSILRTVDYVAAYSLTGFRIAALAWMALVALGLVLICWRMLRGRSAAWLINVNVAAAALVVTGFALVDTDRIAATWNVRHARDVGGPGAAVDLCYLRSLGGSALPALIELEGRTGIRPELRDRVRSVRGDVMVDLEHRMQHGGWTWRGARRLAEARAMLARMPANVSIRPGGRRCDGSIVPPPAPVPAPAPMPTPQGETLTAGARR